MIDDIKSKQVTFTGKEYLEYRKYQDKQRLERQKRSSKWYKKNWTRVITVIALLCVTVLVVYMIDTITPAPEPTPLAWTWNGIGMFLAICAGIGWLIHGVGFAIIGKLR